jgi:hypothetical protein
MLSIGSGVAAPRRVSATVPQAARIRHNAVSYRRPAQQLTWGHLALSSFLNPKHQTPSALSSAAAPRLPAPEQPTEQQAEIFVALQRCRAIFSCLAFCAVYAFLSWGSPPGPPFASAALAIGEAPASGASMTPAGKMPTNSNPPYPLRSCLRCSELCATCLLRRIPNPKPALPRPAGLTSTAKSAWAGLAAGFLHTLCGPDHLAVRAGFRGTVAGVGT